MDEKGGGGTFQVPGDLLFLTQEEAEAYTRRAWRRAMGMTGMTRQACVTTRGRRVTTGVTIEARMGVRRGVRRGMKRMGTRG